MDAELDGLLRSERAQLYVHDLNEQLDLYMGRAEVPLLPLAQGREISGEGRSALTSSLRLQTRFLVITWIVSQACSS